MATKKAAADKGSAKRTPKGSKTAAAATTSATEPTKETYLTLESESDTTATTPTDKDLQEGAISDVVTETAETPVVKTGEKKDDENVTVTKVYRTKVTHLHASGPKKPYHVFVDAVGSVTDSIFKQPDQLAKLEAAAIAEVNRVHGLDLVHGAENVTVEPTLVDFYFVEG